jgi:hypothetical protein
MMHEIDARYLVEMRAALREIMQGSRPRNLPPGLVGHMQAVKAAHDRDMTLGHIDAARVWHRLLGELRDISDGIASPSLTPTFRRKGMPHWKANLLGVALQAMDRLIEQYGEAEAARRVLPHVQRQIPQMTPARLRNLRREAQRTDCRLPRALLVRYHAALPPPVSAWPRPQQAEWLVYQLEHAPAVRSGIDAV